MSEMTWQDALDRIYGFLNWETRPPGTQPTFELDRIRAMLAEMEDPQLRWPAVHVGGTNGKGSTCAFAAAGLRAAGYRVGLYTSPHLHTLRERIRVDDRLIREDEVIGWLERRAPMLEQHADATTFEVLTAMAFEHFAEREVDVAVVEVGLGGRLDTTRVVRPAVSVITSIGLDHQALLGDTLRQIASDKVGILRPGVSLVSAAQEDEAAVVLAAETERLGCPLLRVGREIGLRVEADDVMGTRVALELGPAAGEEGPRRAVASRLGLGGAHQAQNAACAAAALDRLDREGRFRVPSEAIAAGLEAARWPARLELFSAGDATLLVDGAHNAPGVAALGAALRARFPGTPVHLILGIGGGKDASAILDGLLPLADRVTTARADHPKALPAEALAEQVRARGRDAHAAASPAAALERALAEARPGDVVLAAGSIFLAGDVREAYADLGGFVLTDRDPPIPSGARLP